MQINIPEYAKKVIQILNLKEEDLAKPNFKYYIGYVYKSKSDKAGYRLFTDAIININGLRKYAIGIRSYKIDNWFKQKTFYLYYWKEKTDKHYTSINYEVYNIIDAFEKIYNKQQNEYLLPCFRVSINNEYYVELLANRDYVYLYSINNKVIRQFPKDIIFTTYPDAEDPEYCRQLSESAIIVDLDSPLTVRQYLLMSFLLEYIKILNKYNDLAKGDGLTQFM